MHALSRLTLLVTALLLIPTAGADNGPLEETFTAFARCDGSFFRSLHTHADTWRSHARLATDDSNSWIEVGDRGSEQNAVVLRNAPSVSGLRLETYFDRSVQMGTLGGLLHWGFTVDAPLEVARKRLLPLVDHPEQVHSGPKSSVRNEFRAGGEWHLGFSEDEPTLQKKVVDRMLLLTSEAPGKTTVSCYLQGALDGPLLAELRPDIPRTRHPVPTTVNGIADVPISADARTGLDVALLAPRLASLTYKYTTLVDGHAENQLPALVEMTTEDGLINQTVTYSPALRIERQTKAGLFQLKSSSNRSEGRVLLTRWSDLTIPNSWEPGSIISAIADRDFVAGSPGEKPADLALVCRVGKRYPASRIHAALPGDAIPLDCSDNGSRDVKAFIEALGVALDLEGTSGDSIVVNKIQDVEIIR